jgi:hypothetical protein
MSKIKEFKKELKTIISAVVPGTIVTLTRLFPGNTESLDEMKKDAKGESEGVVYITYAGRRYGQKKGGNAYHPYESFLIYIFSKTYSDEADTPITDIEILLETITDAIYMAPATLAKQDAQYDFIDHLVNPVFTQDKDFYMAVLEIGRWLPIYPYN